MFPWDFTGIAAIDAIRVSLPQITLLFVNFSRDIFCGNLRYPREKTFFRREVFPQITPIYADYCKDIFCGNLRYSREKLSFGGKYSRRLRRFTLIIAKIFSAVICAIRGKNFLSAGKIFPQITPIYADFSKIFLR